MPHYNILDLPNSKMNELVAKLKMTMKLYGGIGLSANQCGVQERVFVIGTDYFQMVCINPKIIEKSETTIKSEEGCLSYPGLYLKVGRPDRIKVRFQAAGGQVVEKEFDGLTAVCIQHEIDHLDGIVYTDLVSPIKLEQAKRKVKSTLMKMQRATVPQEETTD